MICFTSCDSILDNEPKTQITEDVVYNNYSDLYAYLLSSYDVLQGSGYYGRDFIVDADIMADNTRLSEKNSGRFDEEEMNYRESGVSTWDNDYEIISTSNNVLYAVQNLSNITDEQQKDLIGQAYFLRALAYFDLLRVYAREPNHLVNNFNLACPIVLAPFSFNTSVILPERAIVTDVYAQVESDLLNAISFLNNDNLPYYASELASKALLSRVYLYEEKWADAAEMANDIIVNSGLELTTAGSYSDIYKKDSEAILNLAYATDESLKYDSLQSIFMEQENTLTGYGDVVPTDNLLNTFQNNSDRKTIYRAAKKGTEDVYFSTKYNGNGGAFGVDNINLIRTSEVYLNAAEAYAKSQNYTKARILINILRSHRNLTNIEDSVTGQDLINIILKERRLELCFEGHRFYDLKRLGNGIYKDDPDDNLDWDDYRIVKNIPIHDTDVNTNLIQNPQY